MGHDRKGIVYDQIPFLTKPQAEINVVECHGQHRVKASDCLERVTPHHHACRCHGAQIALADDPGEVAVLIAAHALEGVACNAPVADNDAGMLNGSVFIEQPGAGCTDFRPQAGTKQFSDEVRIRHLRVIVQEQEVLATGCRGAEIVDGGVIKALTPAQHPEIIVRCFARIVIIKDLLCPGSVLHNDKFEIPIG